MKCVESSEPAHMEEEEDDRQYVLGQAMGYYCDRCEEYHSDVNEDCSCIKRLYWPTDDSDYMPALLCDVDRSKSAPL